MKTPRIQILTIGNELLEGQIVNTNSTYVCSKLYQAGYLSQSQITVLDDPQTIERHFDEGLKNFDIVICSGGLGPTLDDLTLEVACSYFKSSLVYNEALEKKLKRLLKGVSIENLKESAYIPKKGFIFSNHVGMVPGYVFKKGKKKLILLPGVPHEFQHLVDKEVLPLLKKEHPFSQQEFKKVLHLCRVPESNIAPYLEELKAENSKIDFGVYPHSGILSVHVKSSAAHKKDAEAEIRPIIQKLQKRYPQNHFDGKFNNIQEALHDFFIQKKLKVSFVESCTGGAIASLFTQIPDASKYLYGALVAYHNEVKKYPLGVSDSTLKKEGAVSKACAEEMALGANRLFKTDLAMSTTGTAGPSGGTKEKPVGTVFVALAYQDKIILSQKFSFHGSREAIIKRTIHYLLAEFWMNRDNI